MRGNKLFPFPFAVFRKLCHGWVRGGQQNQYSVSTLIHRKHFQRARPHFFLIQMPSYTKKLRVWTSNLKNVLDIPQLLWPCCHGRKFPRYITLLKYKGVCLQFWWVYFSKQCPVDFSLHDCLDSSLGVKEQVTGKSWHWVCKIAL